MIADTDDLVRVLATYYLSRQAFGNHLVPVERITVCEWSDGDDMVASWTRSWRPGPCPGSSITTTNRQDHVDDARHLHPSRDQRRTASRIGVIAGIGAGKRRSAQDAGEGLVGESESHHTRLSFREQAPGRTLGGAFWAYAAT